MIGGGGVDGDERAGLTTRETSIVKDLLLMRARGISKMSKNDPQLVTDVFIVIRVIDVTSHPFFNLGGHKLNTSATERYNATMVGSL